MQAKPPGIRITNLWPNRLIGDARCREKRFTYATFAIKPGDPLLVSGLIGRPPAIQLFC